MKLNKLFILSIFILAVILLGAVSAAEDNSTLTADETHSEAISDPADEKVSPDIRFGSFSGEHFVTDEPSLWVEIYDEDASGSVSVQVDGIEKANRSLANRSVCFDFDEYGSDLKFNTPYNISLSYSGDEKYAPWSVTDAFTLNYIKFERISDLDVDVQQWSETTLPQDAGGNVSLYVDGNLYGAERVADGKAFIWLKGFKYGLHSYEFRYSGDKKYPAQNFSGIFNVSYRIDVGLDDGDIFRWADGITLEIFTPNVCNEITLNKNGASEKIVLDDYGNACYTLNNLKFGENLLIFSYEGDSNHPARTISKTVYVVENVDCPKEIRYISGDSISIKMPEDANGKIIVLENGTEIASSQLTNGTAKVDLSFLGMGNHSIVINYTGNDYNIRHDAYGFEIIPYVNYTKSIKMGEDNALSFIVPEDADGYVTLEYEHEMMANKSIVNGKACFDLDFLKIGEKQSLTVAYTSLRYGNFTRQVPISLRNVSREGKLIISAPKTLVYDSSNNIYFDLGLGAEGNLAVTIANSTFQDSVNDGSAYVPIWKLVKGLDFGTYTLKATYSGDEYYGPISNETAVCISYVSFTVPELVSIGQRDRIYVSLAEDATGKVNLYIDGKYVKSDEIFDRDYDCYMFIDLSDLDFGEYKNVEVKYMGDYKYKPYSEKHAFNVTYSIDIAADGAYGNPVDLFINCFANINGEGILTVGGKSYTVALKNGRGSIEIPDLDLGICNATFSYNGDSTYPSQTVTDEIAVLPQIRYDDVYYIGEDMNVSIRLPGDANGSLVVEIYDDGHSLLLNKSKALKDGVCEISIGELKFGTYSLYAYYTGTDYDVAHEDTYISISIKVNDSDLVIGGENNVLIEMPSDATGHVNVELLDDCRENIFNRTYELVDGRATISLKGFESGYYYAQMNYIGNYGNYSFSKGFYIQKHTAAVSISIPTEIIAMDTSTITFTLPKDATGEVWFEIGDDYFYANVINGKASVKITPQTKGVKFVFYGWMGDGKYESWSGIAYVMVLKTPTIKASDLKMYYADGSYYKATAYDSFGKPVVGKYVAFYINGKKFKSVKTDKKGVAKLKITKTPNVYKITVKYRGASTTKKLTVKRVLTLKAVKVKKSAKKIVLTATLKKGKKAIKGKYVTFKFNGKSYKIKTNRYGVAKITIKKSVLKKLKAGKTVKYQATYLKDTVKKSAKVKK